MKRTACEAMPSAAKAAVPFKDSILVSYAVAATGSHQNSVINSLIPNPYSLPDIYISRMTAPEASCQKTQLLRRLRGW